MNIWKRLNAIFAGAALAITALAAPSAIAGGAVTGGATEWTQLMNNAELIDVAITESENLAYSIRQYQIMYENMRALPDHVKQQAQGDLRRLAQIVASGRAVSYSSGQIDEDYRREHRTFEHYEQMQRGEGGARNHQAYSERYRDWSEANHDSVRGALRAAGLQAQQFDREDSALKMIERQMETAVGAKQLLQAGGSISAMQVEQLQKLRQLTMAQMQLQTAQVGGQIDRQAENDSDLQRALKPAENLNENRGGGLGWEGSVR